LSVLASPAYDALRRRAEAGDPVAQFQYGIVLASQQQYAPAARQLSQAAQAGVADAHAWLALFLLYGYETAPDPVRAVSELHNAEAKGSGEAGYRLAMLGWCDRLQPRTPATMAARLVAAAQRDHAAALRALALVYAREAGARAELAAAGDACLQRAAALGDRIALYLLGRRCAASTKPGFRERAPALFATAAALRSSRAGAHAPPGAMPVRVEAPRVSGLPVPSLDTRSVAAVVVHCEQPFTETLDMFLSEEECEYFIALAEPHLQRSAVYVTSGEFGTHHDRTSSDATLHGARDDFGALWLEARMIDRLGVPLDHAEYVTVLRYLPGEEYRPHRDYLPPGARGNSGEADQPGQRVHTVFAYLNDVEAGGETVFPSIGVSVAPRRGRIVHFRNLDASGAPQPDTLHAGLPVKAGEKWLATIWTRQRRYRA
jgi:hypothetical protein